METDTKRTIDEIITLYNLEPEMRSIFVEGVSDKVLIEYYLVKNDISDVTIYEIDSYVDFSSLYSEKDFLKRNNKKKLVELAKTFDSNFPEKLHFVLCIADKDFDEILEQKIQSQHLVYTDYNSLELYLFQVEVISKLYQIVLHGFPIEPEKTLSELKLPLKELFLFRYAKEVLKLDDDFEMLSKNIFEKHFDVKSNGNIYFEKDTYIHKILVKNNLLKIKLDFLEKIEEGRKLLTGDFRNFIRGHDFVYLLFLQVDKFKRNLKFNEQSFERSFFGCIEVDNLNGEELFKQLIDKYR